MRPAPPAHTHGWSLASQSGAPSHLTRFAAASSCSPERPLLPTHLHVCRRTCCILPLPPRGYIHPRRLQVVERDAVPAHRAGHSSTQWCHAASGVTLAYPVLHPSTPASVG